MGKTRDDEKHEAGVHDGQRGDFLDDLIQGLTQSGSVYDKGYDYGAKHRYGPEERYHTWDNRGSNDPKSNEGHAETEESSYEDYGTGDYRHEGSASGGVEKPSYSGGYGYSESEYYTRTGIKPSSEKKSASVVPGVLAILAISLVAYFGISGRNHLQNTKADNKPKLSVPIADNEIAAPIDAMSEGKLNGIAKAANGDPIIISSYTSTGALRWKKEIKHGQGLEAKHLAPIDYDKDGNFDELLAEISGSTAKGYSIGPEAYIFNFLILNSDGSLIDMYRCGYKLDLVGNYLTNTKLAIPTCSAEEGAAIYSKTLNKYGYRNGNGFVDETFLR